MRISVNGTKLYFDVVGSGLVPDGEQMKERPTVILLHGGPGADHSIYKPDFDALSEVAQVIYLDHRGNGRSGQSEPAKWNLAQWGDDVHGFCEALGIEKPIVIGTSFGGFVAQAYATRHPQHVGKLGLISTAAKFEFPEVYAAFERVGGAEIRAVAEAYWGNPTSETRAEYGRRCLPYYTTKEVGDPDWLKRVKLKDDVALHFNGPKNEQGKMDFRAALAKVTCPVLVMVGSHDPITPPAFSEVIVKSLTSTSPEHLVFDGCGHGIVGDDKEGVFDVLKRFVNDA